MVDLGAIVQIALAAGAVAGLVVTLRWLGGEDGVTLADLFRIPVDPPRPRGVQEAEPPRWQVDRLGRPSSANRWPSHAQVSASSDSISLAYHASKRSPDQPRTSVSRR